MQSRCGGEGIFLMPLQCTLEPLGAEDEQGSGMTGRVINLDARRGTAGRFRFLIQSRWK